MKNAFDGLARFLRGKKTYACALMVIAIGAALKAGLLDLETAASMAAVFLGLMGASTRSAISRKR